MHLLSVFSLRNRALIALLTLVVGVFGGSRSPRSSRSCSRRSTSRSWSSSRTYPGASPDVVETDVSTPIETGDPGRRPASSRPPPPRPPALSTRLGLLRLRHRHRHRRAEDPARDQPASSTLPECVDPQVLTGSLDDFPVIQIAVTSDLDSDELSSRLEASTITDLAAARRRARGGAARARPASASRSPPTPTALAANGFSNQSIRDALDDERRAAAAGQITEDGRPSPCRPARARPRPTTSPRCRCSAAGPTTLPDGTVVAAGRPRSAMSPTSRSPTTRSPAISRVNGEPALTIAVTKTPGRQHRRGVERGARRAARPRDGARRRRRRSPSCSTRRPSSSSRSSRSPRRACSASLFAVLVILVFLLSVRSTLVTAISIPRVGAHHLHRHAARPATRSTCSPSAR